MRRIVAKCLAVVYNSLQCWRARTKRALLEVTVEPFGRLLRTARKAIEAEAERLAPFRDRETV